MFLIVILADHKDAMTPTRWNPRFPFFGMVQSATDSLPQLLQMYDGITCFVMVTGCGFGISAMILVFWVVCVMAPLPQLEHFSTS